MKLTPRMVQCTLISPWGTLLLAAQDAVLSGVWFVGQAHMPDTSGWPYDAQHPVLQSAATQLQAFFVGARRTFDLPIDWHAGTPFQQSVWQSLASIPLGQTCTYSSIAQRLGKPRAVRAVAHAIARNRWMLVLPCHRVLGATGALTGYAGGLQRKAALLELESRF